jgi:diadenylate cyclase
MTPVHRFWLLDLVDILLVAVLFYRLLILVKGTRSAQMYMGLLVIVLVGLFAREFDLIAIRWIVDSLKTVWLIAFVILFQPELRHALALFGRTRYFRSFLRGDNYGVLGEMVRAVETLSQQRHGALIVLERNTGLRNFVETGTRIDAKFSAELLVTLFSPGSPLHDGAVIVREDTVIAASCILPLSSNPRASAMLGTRHRAALGLSEETDAAVIAVSEQTGAISVSFRGRLKQRLDEGELRSELSRIFRIRPQDEAPEPAQTTPGEITGPGGSGSLNNSETAEKAAG